MTTRISARHWLSFIYFLCVVWAVAAKDEPLVSVEAIDILQVPGGLPKTGYWHKEYNDRCGVDMFEAHGANAGMSFTFIGSGFVARLLSCEACSPIAIYIDDSKEPITVDLSDRGFRCPTGSPVYTKTDLKHGQHTIRIKRLEEGKTMKVMKFEYLTHQPPTSGESAEQTSPPSLPDTSHMAFSATPAAAAEDVIFGTAAASSIAGSAMKSAAKVAAKQAVEIAMSYAVMVGVKFVAKAAMEYVTGDAMGDNLSDGSGDFCGADRRGWFDTTGAGGGSGGGYLSGIAVALF